ncbi:hypothetical protein DV738_g3935, partial [Chaetothyriales sp. CBS 135597]
MKPPRALNAAILVTVRPAPSSIIYSAKILQQLQSFGQLHYFKPTTATPAAVVPGTPIATATVTATNPSAESARQTYRAVFESSDAAARAVDASPLTVHAFDDTPSARALDPFNVFGWHQRKQPHPYTFVCELLAVSNEQPGPLPDSPSAHLLATQEHDSSLRQSLIDAGTPLNLIHGLSTPCTNRHYTETDSGKQQLPPVRKFPTGPRLRKMWSKSSADT